jgi:hypothetical protein
VQHEAGGADPRGSRAEHEGEAPEPESHAADAGIGDALDQDVDGLRENARNPDSSMTKADLHAENQVGGDQRPHRVDRVDVSGGGNGGVASA